MPEVLIFGNPLILSLSSLHSGVLQLALSVQLQAWMGHGSGLRSSATSRRPMKWSSNTWTMEDMIK